MRIVSSPASAYVDLMAVVPLDDDQGTADRPHKLTVYFIPAKIEILLAQFGDKPSRGERLVVVPILLVSGRKAAALCIERRNLGGRGATRLVRHRRRPVRHARAHPERCAASGLGCECGSFPKRPPPASAGEAIVTGRFDWSETLPGWIRIWLMRWHGADYQWGISGVN
jgi:hypothetical protein